MPIEKNARVGREKINPGQVLSWLSVGLAVAGSAFAQDSDTSATGSIFAAAACAGCHGKAGENNRQYLVWLQHDAHSRAYATLGTARAARMAEALAVAAPATNARCTTCHAPLQTVLPALLAPESLVSEGVSCASCHGATGNWLRSHTRADFTHNDRVAAGMRELRDVYHRANACVACHQNTEPALVTTGRHPALVFDLDGMTQSEPKHWSEVIGFDGAQAWFVGQVVALREMSAGLRAGRIDATRDTPRWQALLWVVQHSGLDQALPQFHRLPPNAEPSNLVLVADLSDQLAQGAVSTWSPAQARAALVRLAATQDEFLKKDIPLVVQATRAERLVLALDRLLAAQPTGERPAVSSARLDELFRLVQSEQDFVPGKFATSLAAFAQSLDK